MLLTEQEIFGCLPPEEDTIAFARAIESAVLEKLKAQGPFGYYENGRFSITVDGGPDKWRERKAYRGAIYTNPLPPADVVRDAERWRMHVRLYSERLGVPEEDVTDELDAAMKEMK